MSQGPRVLLVEDNPSLRKLFKLTLHGAGYCIWEAADGREARAVVERHGLPNCALIDLLLPDEDGTVLLSFLRRQPGGESLPAVAVSGALSQLAEVRAASGGFTAYLTKPVEMTTLLEVVRRQLLPEDLEVEPASGGQRVLVVDDNAIQGKLLKLRLAELGYQVETARDGKEALELLQGELPDLVVSDVLMPRLDGFQLCQALRASERFARLPILLVSSSYVQPEDRELAHKLGASDYIFRTPDLLEVLKAVREALGSPEIPTAILKELPGDYLARLSLQLERQLHMNEGLNSRCGHLSTALALIATLSGILLRSGDLRAGLREVLERLVGEASFDAAAIYLLHEDELSCVSDFPPGALPVHERDLRRALGERRVLCLGRSPSRVLVSPLRTEERPVGLLCMRENRWESEADALSFARALGGQLGQGVALASTVAELTVTRERFSQLAQHIDEVFWLSRARGEGVLYVSPACERLFGLDSQTLMGDADALRELVIEEDRPDFDRAMSTLQDGRAVDHSFRIRRADGTQRWVWQRAFPIRDGEGTLYRLCGVASDITDHRLLEQQLRQSTKMEAVGRLAGGVAHDFNNLLTVITGFTELARMQLRQEDPLLHDLDEIRRACERAANLTRQLLTFSRRHVQRLAVVDVNETLREMDRMLRRIIGEDIELVLRPLEEPVRTEVDPGHLEQIVVNLVVNARDAMPTGGKLLLSTQLVDLDDPYVRHHYGVSPGRYVVLEVTDTGCGMDEATRQHIFEPFFTTKGPAGSGLGLATVFGIVEGLGGHLGVYSEPDHGTTMKVYLPAVDKPISVQVRSQPPRRGSETVLLVEDDPSVRAVARLALRQYGYRIVEAGNGMEAISLCEHYQGSIDLVLTDVIMPNLSGPAMMECLVRARPELRVLYMSGYPDEALERHGLSLEEIFYLEKPFTPDALARKVREALDA